MNKKYLHLTLASMAAIPFVISATTVDSYVPESTMGTQSFKLGDPRCNTQQGGVVSVDGSSWSGMPGPGTTPSNGEQTNQPTSTGTPRGRGDYNIQMTFQGMPNQQMGYAPGAGGNSPNEMPRQNQAGEDSTPSMGPDSSSGMGMPGMNMGGPGMTEQNQSSENNSTSSMSQGSGMGMGMGGPPGMMNAWKNGPGGMNGPGPNQANMAAGSSDPRMGMNHPMMGYGPWGAPNGMMMGNQGGMTPPSALEHRLDNIERRLDELMRHLQNLPKN